MVIQLDEVRRLKNRQVVERWIDAFNRSDLDGLMTLMTEKCVLGIAFPGAGSEMHTGQAAVRGFLGRLQGIMPEAFVTPEEIFLMGDRCVMRWRCDFIDPHRIAGRVRGVDLFRIRLGRVAEKVSYVLDVECQPEVLRHAMRG